MMRQLLIASLLLVAACGDKDLSTPAPCNPLGGSACITPWPSAIYEIDDATTATGRRLDDPGRRAADELRRHRDRARALQPPGRLLVRGADRSPRSRPASTARTSSTTSDIAAERHRREPDGARSTCRPASSSTHFAELDARAPDKPASQALYIRPAADAQAGGTRYAVAIKKTLKAKDGGELPISEGFQAILDGETTSHPLLERVRPRYADIFAALEAQGHRARPTSSSRGTSRPRSRAIDARRPPRRARRRARGDAARTAQRSTSRSPTTTVPSDTRIARRIDGTYDAPLFLTDNGGDGHSTRRSLRDGDGTPIARRASTRRRSPRSSRSARSTRRRRCRS